MFRKVLIILIPLLLQHSLCGQMDDGWRKSLSFFGVKTTFLEWETFYEHADLIIEPSLFTQVDFTANVYKEFRLGALLNISTEEQKLFNAAINIGFKNMAFSLETGSVVGKIESDALLDDYDWRLSGRETDFSGDWRFLKIYRTTRGVFNIGFGYLDYELPDDVEIPIKTDTRNYIYMDPNARHQIYGAYMEVDMFNGGIQKEFSDFSDSKINPMISAELFFGMYKGTPSDIQEDRIASDISAISGSAPSVSMDPTIGMGGQIKSEFFLFMSGESKNGNTRSGFALGYEGNMFGNLTPKKKKNQKDHRRYLTGGTQFTFGPFFRYSLFWK